MAVTAARTWDAIVVGGRPQRPGRGRLPGPGRPVDARPRAARAGRRDRRHPRAEAGVRVPAARPHRRPAQAVGRPRPRPARPRPAPRSRPRCASSRRPPTARRSPSTTTSGRTADGLRLRSGHDAANYAGFDRLVRSLGRFLAELGGSAPPDIHAPGPGRRPDRPEADPRRSAAWASTTAARSCGSCRWRSPTSWPSRSRPTRSAGSSPRAASRTRRWVPGRPARPPSSWPTRPATTAARRARRSMPGAARAPCPRRWPPPCARPAARSGPAAEVVQVTSRDGRATGVVLASGEEIGARIVVAGIDPKQVLTRLVDPVVIGPEPALAGRQHPDPGHAWPRSTWPWPACPSSAPPAAAPRPSACSAAGS